jgi:G:T-mismatch repair DNA endonuclease (very short patch repair protein)
MPKANNAYWTQKFAENIERDARKTSQLRQAGGMSWSCGSARS